MIRVEPLKKPISWRGQRYPKGCTLIPEDLAIALQYPQGVALNLIPQQSGVPDKSATQPQPVADLPPALKLLNSGDAAEIAALPTIGKGAAKRLVERRPEGGYESLEQAIALNPEINQQPYRVDWDQVRNWEA